MPRGPRFHSFTSSARSTSFLTPFSRKPQTYGVKVSRIPSSVTIDAIKAIFSKYGRCEVAPGEHSHSSRLAGHLYYVYVNFYSIDDAYDAEREMDYQQIHGSTISVVAQDRQHLDRTMGRSSCSPSTYTVKVTNVSKLVTETVLKQLFRFNGTAHIESMKLNQTNDPVNYAYINYSRYADAERAVTELNGSRVKNTKIQVKHNLSSTEIAPQGTSSASSSQGTTRCTVKVEFTQDLPSASELSDFFSKFGELKDQPKIRQGNPHYAYINFKNEGDAANVSQYPNLEIKPGVTVIIKTRSTASMPSTSWTPRASTASFGSLSSPASSLESKQIPCSSVVSKLLTSSDTKYAHYRSSIAPVSLTCNVHSDGLVLFGERSLLPAAEAHILAVIKDLQQDHTENVLKLPCMYIPAFSNQAFVKRISEIQQECKVEFNVQIGPECMKDVCSFSEMVSSKLAAPGAEVSSFGIQLHQQYLSDHDSSSCTSGSSRSSSSKDRSCPQNSVTWLYEDDHKRMVPYSASECREIEKMYLSKKPTELIINKKTYTFDFTRMKQINTSTQYKRAIQRQAPVPCLSLQISGLKEHIDEAEAKLMEELEKLRLLQTHQLPEGADSDFQADIMHTLQKYFVSVEIVEGQVWIRGVEGYIKKIMLILHEESLKFQVEFQKKLLARTLASATPQSKSVPSHWESQTGKVELKEVSSHGTEWKDIEKQFKVTLPSKRITSIKRIQNKWQWDRYSFAKERMSERNGGTVNEKMLFHGTRSTPPEKIYKSEQGFDFRFSSTGMWGTGTYFAVNASYSDGYAYTSSYSGKQMILASVLTGETCRCPSNSSLKKPPINPRKRGTFEDELYDSVSGYTNGSDVFIIYDHEKAYPSYLITYC